MTKNTTKPIIDKLSHTALTLKVWIIYRLRAFKLISDVWYASELKLARINAQNSTRFFQSVELNQGWLSVVAQKITAEPQGKGANTSAQYISRDYDQKAH